MKVRRHGLAESGRHHRLRDSGRVRVERGQRGRRQPSSNDGSSRHRLEPPASSAVRAGGPTRPERRDEFRRHRGSSSLKDACTVITKADVEAVDPITIDPKPETQSEATRSVCDWQRNGTTENEVSLRSAPARRPCRSTRTTVTIPWQHVVQPVSGLGDDAYWSPGFGTLSVLHGQTVLDLQVGSVKGKAFDLATAKKLAVVALGRLD